MDFCSSAHLITSRSPEENSARGISRSCLGFCPHPSSSEAELQLRADFLDLEIPRHLQSRWKATFESISSVSMPPTVITVRHAQGHHNVNVSIYCSLSPRSKAEHAQNQWRIYDATLTDLGHQECATLAKNFPHHKKVDLLVASPLRRTIQTAVLSFGPVLARPEVPFLLHPKAQEVSERNCNIGFERDELKNVVKGLFEGQDLGFDLEGRVDYDGVVDGWNSKVVTNISTSTLRLTCCRQDTGDQKRRLSSRGLLT